MFLKACRDTDTDVKISRLPWRLWGWLESEVYKRYVDTAGGLIARVLDSATPLKGSKDPLRLARCDLGSRVAKCVKVDGGILEHLL